MTTEPTTEPKALEYPGDKGWGWAKLPEGWSVEFSGYEECKLTGPGSGYVRIDPDDVVYDGRYSHEEAAALNDIRLWAQCVLSEHSSCSWETDFPHGTMVAFGPGSVRDGWHRATPERPCICGGKWFPEYLHCGGHWQTDKRLSHFAPDGRRVDVEVTP